MNAIHFLPPDRLKKRHRGSWIQAAPEGYRHGFQALFPGSFQ